MPPVITQVNQPEDFGELLEEISFVMMETGIRWNSPQVVAYINLLHQRSGYTPPNFEVAVMAMSYYQLNALLNKLKTLPRAAV